MLMLSLSLSLLFILPQFPSLKFFHTLPHHGNEIARDFELVKSQFCSDGFPNILKFVIILNILDQLRQILTKMWYFIRIVCGYNCAKLKKKNHHREPTTISIYLVMPTSQKSEKHVWLFIQACADVTPCMVHKKARINQRSFTSYLQSVSVIFFGPQVYTHV